MNKENYTIKSVILGESYRRQPRSGKALGGEEGKPTGSRNLQTMLKLQE